MLFNNVMMTYHSLKKKKKTNPENNLQIDWVTR